MQQLQVPARVARRLPRGVGEREGAAGPGEPGGPGEEGRWQGLRLGTPRPQPVQGLSPTHILLY